MHLLPLVEQRLAPEQLSSASSLPIVSNYMHCCWEGLSPSKEKTPAFLPSGSHWWAQLGNPSEKQWIVISFRANLSTSLHPQPLIPRWSCVCVSQSCLTLCDPMDYSPPGSSVHGILQERILGWFAISFSRGSSWLRDQTCASCIGKRILYHWATRETLPKGLLMV